MLINFNRIDFFDEVIVIYLMKEVFDSIFYWSFECVIKIDIDDVAIFKNQGLTTWAKRL